MEHLYKRWKAPRCAFGDAAVLVFLVVQGLDGALTYIGIRSWGPGIEANPVVSSAVQLAGLAGGLAIVKLSAATLGIALHLHRIHNLVAFLTVFYLGGAIIPWTALFLMQ